MADDEGEIFDLGGPSDTRRATRGPICLVGKLCTERPFNTYALIDVMVKAFKAKGRVSAREWGNKLLMFTFDDEIDRDWALKNQPWHFDGHLFAILALKGTEQPSTIKVDKASFWVRVYDLPISCQTEENLISLAKKVGALETYEPPGDHNVGNFIRFKVEIDVTKKLMKGFRFRFGGELLWAPLKYESLPLYCFCCGYIGHNFKFCGEYDKNECPSPSDIEFGPTLKASPLKRVRGPRVANKIHYPHPVSVPSPSRPVTSSPVNPLIVHAPQPDTMPPRSPPNITPLNLPPEPSSLTSPFSASVDTPDHTPQPLLSGPREHPSIQNSPATVNINAITDSFCEFISVSNTDPQNPKRSSALLPRTTTDPETCAKSTKNPRRTTWKRDAREKGKSPRLEQVEIRAGSKRSKQDEVEWMEVDVLELVSKKSKVDSDARIATDLLSAVDACALHRREQ